MHLLRIGRQARWAIVDIKSAQLRLRAPDDIQDALEDLKLDPGEDGLSVYRVGSADEASRVAIAWACEHRERADNCDYVLFDEACVELAGLQLVCRPDTHAKDALLRERHAEIEDVSKEGFAALAARILAHHDTRVVRIKKKDVERALNTQAER